MPLKPLFPLCFALLTLGSAGPAASNPLDSGEPILPSVAARVTEDADERAAGIPSDAALVAAGATIGEIHIDPLPIFDTQRTEEDSALFHLANRLHRDTRPATIASQLLFATGDRYDPHKLEESERLLRTTRYLHDAWIEPAAWHDGKVDLRVSTRDVWTLNPGVSFGRSGGANTFGVELEELNLLGGGSQISIKQLTEVDRDIRQLTYRDRQLGNSWWRLDTTLADNSDGHRSELALEQPFFALDSRRAGGIWLLDNDRIDSRYDLGEVVGEYRTSQKGVTAFAGISRGLRDGAVFRWTAGFTRDEHRFEAVPGSLPLSTLPSDRLLSYPWVGVEWLEDRYRTTRNQDQIARTEDYPLGWRANLQMGFADAAFGADRSAWMFSGAVRRGVRHGDDNTWQFNAAVTGRYENGRVANTLLTGSVRYYHRESRRFLTYASLETTAGNVLDGDQQILLGGDNGLRGYPLRFQGGTGSWLFTLEQRAYSDWYPFRLFNVGAAAFIDVGSTWGANPYGTPSRGTLKDFGLGLRLGNSRSALGNMLHIDLAYPLDAYGSKRGLQVVIETKRSF